MPHPEPGTSQTGPTTTPPRARLSWAAALALVSLVATFGLWFQTRQELASVRADQRALLAELNAARGTPVIDITGAPVQGSANAPVTLIEFADYECPYCIRHFTQTMPALETNYIKTGKVRYVFRDLPIDSLHPGAIRAHEAARCATEQGRFWEMHARLFSAPGSHGDPALDARATEAGLNIEAFRACLASGRTEAAVRQSVAAAGQLGATGTPTFFIGIDDHGNPNQIRIVQALAGAQPYSEFEKALEAVRRQVN
jgi:protein-disulfide isomerase